MEMTSVFAGISKTAPQEDGSLMVYGKATGSDLDLDQQRCDPLWLSRAMPEWFRGGHGNTGGNIREQHDEHRAVGVAKEYEAKEDGHYIKAHIVDPVAVAKCRAGVFTGFSIGVKDYHLSKSDDAPNGLIDQGSVVEVSLVDRPCLPTATFTMCKSAKPGMQIKAGDFDAQRLLVRCEEFIDKALAPELKKADMTVTLADSLSPEQVERLEEKVADKSVATAVANVDGDVATGCGCCNMCVKPGDGCCDMCEPDGETAQEEQKAVEPELAKTALGELGLLGPAGGEFDRNAALALVKSTLDKAPAEASSVKVPPIMPPEELPDILGAKAAIAIIAQLIQSEAADMVCAPNEDYDIECLMQAVSALRVFIMREKGELGGEPNLMMMAVTPDVEKAKYTADELREMLADGKAFKNPDGDPSYPIGDKADLSNAIHAVGRGSGDHDAIRVYIQKRAAALGASDLIPDSWTSGNKAAEAESTVADIVETAEPVEDAVKAVEPALEKATAPGSVDLPADVVKVATVETSDPEALVKALTAALEKADNPLRKTFEAIVEASAESTAKALGDLGARLERVEQTAVPGGPALRRTEVESKTAQVSELRKQAEHWRAKSLNVGDADLRRGWAARAAELEAKAEMLGV